MLKSRCHSVFSHAFSAVQWIQKRNCKQVVPTGKLFSKSVIHPVRTKESVKQESNLIKKFILKKGKFSLKVLDGALHQFEL